VNAYVGPALSRYLTRLADRLVEAGYSGPVLIIQSHGGVAPIADSVRIAAGSVLSGPAGGVAGSRYAAQLLDAPNLIPFDMGGTSTDICLIVDGEPALVAGRSIGGSRVALTAWTSSPSAPAAAPSRMWTRAASCMSARNPPVPSPPRLLRPRRHQTHCHGRQPHPRLPGPRPLPRRPRKPGPAGGRTRAGFPGH